MVRRIQKVVPGAGMVKRQVMHWIEHDYELNANLPEGIEQLHTALATFWAATHLSAETRMRFGTALAEVIANILQYAVVPGDPPIKLRLRCTPTILEAQIVDQGLSWTMPRTTIAMPEDWEEHGRGLAIAQTILDKLQYRRFRNVNCWRLVLLHKTA